MEKKRNFTLLILGLALLIAGTIFSVYNYKNSYTRSLETGTTLSELKDTIKAVEAGTENGDLDKLNAEKDSLTAEKLSLERPYSYGLILVFFGVLMTVKGIYDVVSKSTVQKADIRRLAQAGLCAALCYIGFAFFKIDIPVGPEKTAFHFGNVFCVLAALLLGGYWGGLAGAVGMSIADLTTAYVTSAPKTFLLKLCIGLIVGFVAHSLCKLGKSHSPKYILGVTFLASSCGMVFNIIADPLVGYYYKTWLLGVPQDISAALAKIAAITTSVNAVVAIIAASVFYIALRPALRKSGLLVQVIPDTPPERTPHVLHTAKTGNDQ